MRPIDTRAPIMNIHLDLNAMDITIQDKTRPKRSNQYRVSSEPPQALVHQFSHLFCAGPLSGSDFKNLWTSL